MRHLILAATLLAVSPAFADPAVISNGTGGNCTCANNGKTWPCRLVRGEPTSGVLPVNRCRGGGYRLVCPEEPTAICHYELVPARCEDPPLSTVCFAGDEPK